MKRTAILIFLFLPFVAAAQPDQWRGPARDGHYPDKDLLKTWQKDGPELIFQVSGIGEGFSTPVEHRGIIYVTGKKDTMDLLTAIDQEGQVKWQIPYGRSWIRSFSNTRCTPTLEENRIYLISGTGQLVCMDAEKGDKLWSANTDADFEAEWHEWGISESPLIVDDMIICTPSGEQTTMVAYDKLTGELIWKSKPTGGERSYVSPVLYEYNDLRFILGMTSRDVIAVDPENGKILWTYPYYLSGGEDFDEGGIMTNTPVFHEDEIFITTGYDFPSVMLKLSADGKSISEKWRNEILDNHHGHVVKMGDYIYGANWKDNRRGLWVCLNWNTGDVMWEKKWHTKGSIITDSELLYIYEEKDGYVGLLKPDNEQFEIISTFQIKDGEGPHWAHPSIYNGKLLIRHGDILFLYNIRK